MGTQTQQALTTLAPIPRTGQPAGPREGAGDYENSHIQPPVETPAAAEEASSHQITDPPPPPPPEVRQETIRNSQTLENPLGVITTGEQEAQTPVQREIDRVEGGPETTAAAQPRSVASGHLVITSSLGRNLQSKGIGQEVRVKSISGARIEQVEESIKAAEVQYSTITILVGSNNVSNKESAESCMGKFDSLIQSTRQKQPQANIQICRIPPRLKQPHPNHNHKVGKLNYLISRKCESTNGLHFIDLKIPSHQECFHGDGVHLSQRGTARLAIVIKFTMHDQSSNQQPRRNGNRNTASRFTPGPNTTSTTAANSLHNSTDPLQGTNFWVQPERNINMVERYTTSNTWVLYQWSETSRDANQWCGNHNSPSPRFAPGPTSMNFAQNGPNRQQGDYRNQWGHTNVAEARDDHFYSRDCWVKPAVGIWWTITCICQTVAHIRWTDHMTITTGDGTAGRDKRTTHGSKIKHTPSKTLGSYQR